MGLIWGWRKIGDRVVRRAATVHRPSPPAAMIRRERSWSRNEGPDGRRPGRRTVPLCASCHRDFPHEVCWTKAIRAREYRVSEARLLFRGRVAQMNRE